MAELIAALSFIPMVLITLIVHEAGHYVAARFFGMRVSGYQVGIGPRLGRIHRGRSEAKITPATLYLDPEKGSVAPGDLVNLWVQKGNEGKGENAVAVMRQTRRERDIPSEKRASVSTLNRNNMLLQGRVIDADQERISIASLNLSVHAIPLAAAVKLPEDPANNVPDAYNCTPLLQRTAVIAAGPLANIMLTLTALAVMTLIPVNVSGETMLAIEEMVPGSPAWEAGIRPGQYISTINNKPPPPPPELRTLVTGAAARQEALELSIANRTDGSGFFEFAAVVPDPEIGLGIRYRTVAAPGSRSYSYHPADLSKRFLTINRQYWTAIASILEVKEEEGTADTLLTGPIMAAHITGQSVTQAGFFGWMAVLAAINISVAVINLVPMPPLDGYRLAALGIQGVRGGREINPILEYRLTVGGIFLIVTLTIYLVLRDITTILQ